jgi:uncharacterized membrane protein (DUF373 family)
MDPETLVEYSERSIRYVEIFAAYLLVVLFAVGVFDLVLLIGETFLDGSITDPETVIQFIDIFLLLFIIVEVYQTAVAYTQSRSVLRVVILAGVIAISRKIITFRPETFPSYTDALINAASLALLLAVLVGALYLIRQTPNPDDIE